MNIIESHIHKKQLQEVASIAKFRFDRAKKNTSSMFFDIYYIEREGNRLKIYENKSTKFKYLGTVSV